MPIMWNQVQNTMPPSVIAQLPVQQQANTADQFAGGLMQGMAQGDQMRAQQLQMAATQQGMDQSKALFPGQQQMQQQDILKNQLAINKATQNAKDIKNERAAATLGPDKWLEWKMKNDPQGAMTYMATQEGYRGQILQNKSSLLDLNTKQHGVADENNTRNVTIFNKVSSLPPEQQQPAFQKYRTDILKQYPDAIIPKEFTPDTFASVMRVNDVIQANQKIDMSNKVGQQQGFWNIRDKLNVEKQRLIKEGKPTDQVDQKLAENQRSIDTLTTNTQTQAQTVYENEFDKELGKKNAEAVVKSGDAIQTLANIQEGINSAKNNLKNVPESSMNPVAGWTGLQKLDPNFQIFNQKVQNLALGVKDAWYKLGGGQGFSNKDAERLEDIARGGIEAYKGTAQQALAFMDRMSEFGKQFEYKKQDKIMKQSKRYSEWKEANPAPATTYFRGDSRFDMDAAIKDHPGQTKEQIIKEAKLTQYGD